MFPTTTKHKPVIAGPDALKACLAMPGALPHLAIGGITTDTIGSLVDAGVRGVAVCSCMRLARPRKPAAACAASGS
jgi:thiamine monophosphate synthase